MGPRPRVLTAAFGLLVAAHFMQALGFASMPLLPVYLDHLHADRTFIGLAMGAAAVGGLVTRPLVGWALDTVGRRATLVTGTLLVAASVGLLGAVTTAGPLVMVLRVVFGVGAGALFSGYFTYVADLVPESRRTEGIALFGISGLLPLAVNPFVGELGLADAALRWVFPVVAVLVAASLLPLLRVPERQQPELEPFRLGDALAAIARPSMRPVWLATVVFGGAVSAFMAFATVAAESRGLSNPGTFFLTYAGGAVLVRAVGASLPDRVGVHNVVAPALGACTAGLVGLALSREPTGFLVAGAVAGLGHGYTFPALMSQVVDRVPDRVRGSATATFTAILDLAILVYTPALGVVADRWGDGVMFVGAAAVVVVGVTAWLPVEHRAGALARPG